MQRVSYFSSFIALVALMTSALGSELRTMAQDASPIAGELADGVEVVASGLTNPRGFAWGVDGLLYLGLAGVGPEIQPAAGEEPGGILGGPTASIVRLEDGCVVTVAEGLPSGNWYGPGWIWGVMDVAFIGDQLYALIGGGGKDFGNPSVPNGVYRITEDGGAEIVADLSTWFRDHPVAFSAPDYGRDGSLFDMEADSAGRLWISEAVGGRLLTVTAADGSITLIADLSEDHLVPTGVALAPEGGAYVGFETTTPYPDEASKVVHVAEDGTVTDVWTGLTAVTDITLGPDGMLYAAEMATGNMDTAPYLRPNSGRIVRQTGPDSLELVATDIPYPVMMGFDDGGALLIAYPAFAPDSGMGQGAIIRLDLSGSLPMSLGGSESVTATCVEQAGSPEA